MFHVLNALLSNKQLLCHDENHHQVDGRHEEVERHRQQLQPTRPPTLFLQRHVTSPHHQHHHFQHHHLNTITTSPPSPLITIFFLTTTNTKIFHKNHPYEPPLPQTPQPKQITATAITLHHPTITLHHPTITSHHTTPTTSHHTTPTTQLQQVLAYHSETQHRVPDA